MSDNFPCKKVGLWQQILLFIFFIGVLPGATFLALGLTEKPCWVGTYLTSNLWLNLFAIYWTFSFSWPLGLWIKSMNETYGSGVSLALLISFFLFMCGDVIWIALGASQIDKYGFEEFNCIPATIVIALCLLCLKFFWNCIAIACLVIGG